MSYLRSRRLPLAFPAPWLMALALLISACAPSATGPGPTVSGPEGPPPSAAPGVAPAAPQPQYRVAGGSPTNILIPGATLPVVGADGAAVPPQVTPGQPERVALLLPLSGRLASIGKSMLDAAQLAVVDLGGSGFTLLPIDTGGTAAGAAAAAEQAIAQNAQLILGPLRAESTRAAAAVAQAVNVPIVSFSNDQRVAGYGVFVMGFLPEAEVDRVVSFSFQRGTRRFALLVPDTEYGVVVADGLRSSVGSLGAQVSHIEFYDPASIDFESILGTLSEIRAAGGADGFEALMIAEGGERMRAIAASLPANGLDATSVRILGTGLWEEQRLGGEPALVGAWYAVPQPTDRIRFLGKYQEVYGAAPHRLASLAYDATAMAALLSRSIGADGFDPAFLAAPNGFLGADGLFRFAPDGSVERGLAVLELTPGGSTVISPGIRTFQTLPAGAAGS